MSGEYSSLQNMNSDYSLNLTFEDINFKVRPAVVVGGHKLILKDICGTFNAGELTVIVGQSGAGKSILMDIMAGYKKPTSGRIYVNGQLRNEDTFAKQSCYIMQDNQIHHTLTVHESLFFDAELRLGHHVNTEQKKKRINEIIICLGLATAQNTKAGDLSGGQRRRLEIGLELITDPPVMFLDEPTSGVDSSIAKQLIYLLHQLSRQGRTVVITLHQPSALLLPMMDKLYAMIDGRCAYIGSVPSLLPYLRQANFICPAYHNPIDFLIEISTSNANELVLNSQNGKINKWNNVEDTDKLLNEQYLSGCGDICLTTLPLPNENPTNKILFNSENKYQTSFWKQFTTLTRRSVLLNWRDPTSNIIAIVAYLAMGLLVGMSFGKTGKDAKYVRENLGMIFFSVVFLMYTAMTVVIITFPLEIPVVRREHFNGWYSTGAYFISTFMSALATQMVCSLAYVCLAYWLCGEPPEVIRFLAFSWIIVMTTYVSLSIGLLIGAIFNVKGGVIAGPLTVMPFTLFSGFMLRYSDASFGLQWIFHISFIKHGFVGLVLSIFGMKRQNLPCSDTYCHFTTPTLLLQELGLSNESYVQAVSCLFGIASTILVLSYIVLKIRLKNKW